MDHPTETLRIDAGEPYVWRVGDVTVVTTLRAHDKTDDLRVTMRLELDPKPDADGAASSSVAVRRTAVLSLDPWTVCWDKGDPLPQPITEDHLTSLLSKYQEPVAARARAMLRARNRELWAEQDMTGYQPRALVRYRNLFPDDFDLIGHHGERAYFLEDYYCLEPHCPCTTVAFTVTELSDDPQGEHQELGNATIELLSPKLSPTGSKAAVSVTQRVMQDPVLQKRVAQRLAECRRIAPAFAVKLGRTPSTVVRLHKVGRNDPCPCGSGNKYKKCCINKPAV